MHEMEEIKRAQEQRVHEVSVKNERKSRDNSAAHFRWILWMILEIFRCEINFLWKVVSRFQSTCDDSEFSCFVLPRQKIAALTHGINPDNRKTFFGNQSPTFEPWGYSHRIQSDDVQRKPGSSFRSRKDEEWTHKWRQTKSRHNSNADICNKAVDYEIYNTGWYFAELCGRTAKTANIGAVSRLVPWSTVTYDLENKIQNTSHYVFWFSIGCDVMDQRSGDGWFFGWVENPRDQFVECFFQTSRCWTRGLLLLWTRSSRIPTPKKKVSLEEQKAQKEDRFLRGRQIAFMIYDYFRVTGVHDTVLDNADLCSVTLHDDNIQELCQRFHPMISWKVCTNWEYMSPRNSKRDRCPIIKNWSQWWRGV